MLLAVTASLFPLLYLTLELPKRIINDAIDARVVPIEVFGYQMQQVPFLALLCGAFLIAVFLHGILKMRINTMKGVLAERLLRRFRYTLIARILRFPSPYFERTSQGELVSMVTSEAEPMGGLMGDALAQPVLQAGQMLTILGFLFLQSFWFGVAACALIPLQAWLIPKLQRQINLLNKKRVVQVRGLAAEIGESAAGASTLRINGGWRFRQAQITARLGRLFTIRFEIYQKKFFMKFLNNFITQLTPFFFFSIGGFLVIRGDVTLGALVAALAAYKDLSSPWKELLTYYNQVQDMSLRWEIITEKFAPAGMVDADLFDGAPKALPRLTGDIELRGVTVRDEDGNPVLDDLSAVLPQGATVAIAANSEEDRRALGALLTRELLPSAGKVTIAGHDLAGLHQSVIALRIGQVDSRPVLFQGSFGENALMPLRIAPQSPGEGDSDTAEAIRAGNSADPLTVPWLAPGLAEQEDGPTVRDWCFRLIEGIGGGDALFRRAVDQRFTAARNPALAAKLIAHRGTIRAAIEDAGLRRHVHYFSEDKYNPALPVADNLLFATPRQPVTQEFLISNPEIGTILDDLGLTEGLLDLSQDVIEMLRRIFGMDGTDHPLFRKLGLEPDSYEAAVDLIARRRGGGALDAQARALLFTVPFRISAEQIGPAFSEEMKAHILDLRRTHAPDLQKRLGDLFAPLDETQVVPELTVFENAIFGKVSDQAGARGEDLRRVVAKALVDAGMRRLVLELIFDVPVALGGAGLPALFAEPLTYARATIKRPDIVLFDAPLASFDEETRKGVYENLRELLPDTTMIHLAERFEDTDSFDAYFEIVQGRLASAGQSTADSRDSAANADLSRKLSALEKTPLFSGLGRRQLRLLAFGARWYRAEAGAYVFHKDDDPSDGAYMVLEGEAGLYLPKTGEGDQLIARVGNGTLVGELGLIRNVPRALDMKAETDLLCLRLGAEEFLAVVENDAATAYKLLQVVAGYVSN